MNEEIKYKENLLREVEQTIKNLEAEAKKPFVSVAHAQTLVETLAALVAGRNDLKNDLSSHVTPSVTPEQMRDGKRYRVIFEGEWDSAYEILELCDGDHVDDWHMRIATRIEEIE